MLSTALVRVALRPGRTYDRFAVRLLYAPPMPSHDLRFGALCWNQWTDWPSLLEAGIRADRLGYDTLRT